MSQEDEADNKIQINRIKEFNQLRTNMPLDQQLKMLSNPLGKGIFH